MKIALVQCPCYCVETPSLGIAYLCAVLKKEGYDVKVFDFNTKLYWNYREYWKPESEESWYSDTFFLSKEVLENWVNIFTNEVLEFNPDVVGFSVQSTSVVFSKQVAKKIKEKDNSKFIIFGGPECIREKPETFLKDVGIDFIVKGEGEITLVELLKLIKYGVPLNKCNGLVFCTNGQIISNPFREEIENLDSLPYPDFSFFEREKYLHRYTLPMITSRGCIRRCVFCTDTWYQRKYRFRSPQNIVSELEYLVKNYKINSVRFNDLLLNGNLTNLEKLCELILRRKIRVFWSGNAIAIDMDKKLLKKMHRAGCRGLIFGIESASQNVIDLMGKNTRISDISSILKKASDTGIRVITNWIVGFPGENRDNLFETVRFVLRHRKYIFVSGSANILAINPSAIIAKSPEKFGVKYVKDFDSNGWVRNDNNLLERRHRQRVFNKFLSDIGLLNDGLLDYKYYSFFKNIIFYFKKRKILSEIKKEL